ncbi:MAG: hypothetical protein H6581_13885 [Bacteroidia bacterium]|nr:hypothetical protein [Bacteroidia bacterium]
MKHAKIIWVVCVLMGAYATVWAQDEWVRISNKAGFSIEIPKEFEVTDGENFLHFKGWIQNKAYGEGGMGLEEKEKFKYWTSGYLKRNGKKFNRLEAGRNPGLASRTGVPAFTIETFDAENSQVDLYVDFDAKFLLTFNFHTWKASDWPLARDAFERMLGSIRVEKPEQTNPSVEDLTLLDPPVLTEEVLAKVEGPLAGRVSHQAFQMKAPLDVKNLKNFPLQAAALPDGGFVVGYNDTLGNAHLQRFDAKMAPVGTEKVLNGTVVLALSGDSKGFAALILKNKLEVDYGIAYSDAFLAGFSSEMKLRFETFLVGDEDLKEEGDQRVDLDHGQNKIAFGNGYHAVYLSTLRHWSDGVNHQGDFVRLVDENGEILMHGSSPKGWDWGVSHSFSKSICFDGTDFNLITVGDGYPRGLAYSRVQPVYRPQDDPPYRKNVLPIAGELGNNDAKDYHDGGIAANDKYALTVYTTTTHKLLYPGRNYTFPKLHLLRMDKNGRPGPALMLYPNAKRSEHDHKLIAYGKGFLLLYADHEAEGLYNWSTWRDRYQLLDKDGQRVGATYDLPTWFKLETPKAVQYLGYMYFDYRGTEPVVLANGDVLWVRQLLLDNKLEIIRIRK